MVWRKLLVRVIIYQHYIKLRFRLKYIIKVIILFCTNIQTKTMPEGKGTYNGA